MTKWNGCKQNQNKTKRKQHGIRRIHRRTENRAAAPDSGKCTRTGTRTGHIHTGTHIRNCTGKVTRFIVTGLGYGDEGKGTIVDALTRRHNLGLVIRHNGGAQAAHNVWTDDGEHHVFAQFGSGSFVPGVKTLLSRFMLVNPAAMINEQRYLCEAGVFDIFNRTFVDSRALITTPWHIVLNRLKENERGSTRHGSCGMGIGETVADSLARPVEAVVAGDLLTPSVLRDKLEKTLKVLCEKYQRFSTTLRQNTVDAALVKMMKFASVASIITPENVHALIQNNDCVFEGAQGTLLDEDFGKQPHTTWSKTTDANALTLLSEAKITELPVHIGVTRWFMTRHGAGPFATEDSSLVPLTYDDDNTVGEFQGPFRAGHADVDLLRYAISVNNRVDYLAVTHLDKLVYSNIMLNKFRAQLGVPIGIASYGKSACCKHFFYEPGAAPPAPSVFPHGQITALPPEPPAPPESLSLPVLSP
jgi:adenylosuccinate synthase